MPPSRHPAPVAQPVVAGRAVGHHLDGLLEGEQAPVADHLAEHHRGVIGVAHEVHVRAGVGPAQHDAPVLPHRRADPPSLVGASQRRCERRQHHEQRQLVDQDDVDEHVDDVGAPRRGDLAQRPPTHGDVGSPISMRAKSASTPTALRAKASAPDRSARPGARGRTPRPAVPAASSGEDVAPSPARPARGCRRASASCRAGPAPPRARRGPRRRRTPGAVGRRSPPTPGCRAGSN